MSGTKNVSKPKALFIQELERPPAQAVGQVTTLAIGEEAGSQFPILAPIKEYFEEKKH